MSNQEILSLINEYQQNYSSNKQIILYPNIGSGLLSEVSQYFPEFDSNIETPLLFYIDGKNDDSKPKWLMLSNARLYYSILYYPDDFNVLNTIPLRNIYSLKIKHNKWIQDTYIELNSKKVGSLENRDKYEANILEQLINSVLNYCKENGILVEDKPQKLCEENLENAELFSIAKKYFDEVNPGGRLWAFQSFYYGSFIPAEGLDKARQEYADFDLDKEKPIIYYDNSWVGKLGSIDSSGFVLTNKYLYYKLYKSIKDKKFSIGRIPLSKIKKFHIKSKFFGWMILNGGRIKFKLTRFSWIDKKEAKIFEVFMQKIIQELAIKVED